MIGIVGRDGGYHGAGRRRLRHRPDRQPGTITPHAEAFQAVIWHLLVSHPLLQEQRNQMGIGDEVMRPAVFLDRDGVISRADCAGGQAVSAALSCGAGTSARCAGGAAGTQGGWVLPRGGDQPTGHCARYRARERLLTA